jgi:Na+-translocating ferredoxin:NAD+ oxidoreductase subunit C
MGVQCFNVATAYSRLAGHRHGEPVISRIVTSPATSSQPRNWEVLLGTPIRIIALRRAQGRYQRAFVMGGPMMGFACPASTCRWSRPPTASSPARPALFPPPAARDAVHPLRRLRPRLPARPAAVRDVLVLALEEFRQGAGIQLFDCIECGCCSYVCPSHIPLVHYFRFAKTEIWARERDKNMADAAKARFEFRNERDEREKAEKAERLAKAAAAKAAEKKRTDGRDRARATEAQAVEAPPVDAEAAKKAAIAAAIERARLQREAAQPKNTDGLTIAQRKEIAEIEARRAPLQAQQNTHGEETQIAQKDQQ